MRSWASHILFRESLPSHRRKSLMPAPSFSLSFPTSPSSNHPTFFSTTDRTPHALRCLEGTTLSNRGQRPRIHDTPPSICLEGSTPQDRFTFYSTTD